MSLVVVPGGFAEVPAEVADLLMRAATGEAEEAPARGVRVALLPEVVEVEAGELFALEVTVDAATAIAHLPVTIEYDPEVVAFEEITGGDFLGSAEDVEVLGTARNPGRLVIGASRLGQSGAVSGRGSVAKVTFRALAPGQTEVRFGRANALGEDLGHVAPLEKRQATVMVYLAGERPREDETAGALR